MTRYATKKGGCQGLLEKTPPAIVNRIHCEAYFGKVVGKEGGAVYSILRLLYGKIVFAEVGVWFCKE